MNWDPPPPPPAAPPPVAIPSRAAGGGYGAYGATVVAKAKAESVVAS